MPTPLPEIGYATDTQTLSTTRLVPHPPSTIRIPEEMDSPSQETAMSSPLRRQDSPDTLSPPGPFWAFLVQADRIFPFHLTLNELHPKSLSNSMFPCSCKHPNAMEKQPCHPLTAMVRGKGLVM